MFIFFGTFSNVPWSEHQSTVQIETCFPICLCHCAIVVWVFHCFHCFDFTAEPLSCTPPHRTSFSFILFCSSLRTCPQGPIWSARGTNMLNLISVLTQFRDHIPRAITLSSSAYTQLLDIDFSSMVNRNESSSRIHSLTKTRTTTPWKGTKLRSRVYFSLTRTDRSVLFFLGNCV